MTTPFPTAAELLADLVRLPSVNPMGRCDIAADLAGEHRVVDYLEHKLRGLGVAVERQPAAPGRDNLIARFVPPSPPPFHVLWECHTDTVPTDGMTVDPFAAAVSGGRLFGRGACDVKGGGAAMLAAFARLVREKPPGAAAVTLAFCVDEEDTFLGVQGLAASGVRADFAVVAEPTGLNVVASHKGVSRWAVATAGVACHSSRPDRGVNAVYRMARLILAAEAYADELSARPPDPELGPPTLSVGVVAGGVSPNTVPDACRIEIDRRLIPGEDAAAAPAELEAYLRAFPGVDFPFTTIPPEYACPPLPKAPAAVIERVGRAIDAVVGRHRVDAVPYGTDASALAAAGVPAVVFGPGDIAQAHTPDEWVELAQVDAAAEVLYRLAVGG